jgi:3-oxoacyl-[acyl-carrier protein] reductase
VDGIVNNVGVDANRSLHELDEADAERTLRTNLLGPWFLTRELMNPLVRAGRPGAVVFLTSLHQWFTRGHPDYSTSKAAIGMLVREMAREMAPTVRVNAVAPGAVNLHDEASKEFAFEEDRARPLLPLGRLGRPHDIAGQVAVLLDNALSGYITGTTIVVDGGLSLHTWLDDLYTSAADERTQNRLV